ncbi:MAG TPA: dTDP-4-dehydrorhamnose reductase [Acetobacteraceae bacterium]|jgi:dTDP-4-dehydrorhamnose reductase|nr:dTDP-4-dehydrorhamnose reductase [Acetobacteraceae bacterium]
MAAPILVTGGTGQVASALAAAGGAAVRVVGRPAFDFDKPESLVATFRAAAPWLVVNAAAYTAVDTAEDDVEAAYRANRDGPGALAQLCRAADIPLIHISTDYVFDGAKGAPYVETDPTGPTGIYGASKLAGEQEVLASGARVIVLRTSWVYAPTGRNFVRTMLRVGAERDRLRVVADQKGCPTTAADLADAIVAIAAWVREGWREAHGGIFHAAGTGETTWHGLAVATFQEAARHGARVPTVEAITTADYPTKATRPADSRLDCAKLASVFGVRLPDWRTSLARTIDTIRTA